MEMMPEAVLELPYDGAKEMFLVDDIENKEFPRKLLETMYDELPAPKKKQGNYSAPPLLRTLRVLRCGRTERFHRLSAPWNRSDPSDKQAYLTGS